MKIKLAKPFAADSNVDAFDTRQIKKALNRLGYYIPFEKVGITGIPDAEIFDALKAFQRDQGLQPTGTTKPDDETIQHLNKAAAEVKNGKYIWRTVGDEKVRKTHAEFSEKMRDFGDSPDPGEDFNCRCWADFGHFKGLNLERTNCHEARKNFKNAQEKVKILSDQLNDLLLQLDKLFDENNLLVQNAQKSLGMQVVAHILNLPYERIGFLGEIIRAYFGNIFSNASMNAANDFIEKLHIVRNKIKHTKYQFTIVSTQLKIAGQKLETAKKKLEECEKNKILE